MQITITETVYHKIKNIEIKLVLTYQGLYSSSIYMIDLTAVCFYGQLGYEIWGLLT